MKFWGNSDTGMVRSENQDTYLMASLPRGTELLLVCDGMGGAQGGKVASTIACRAFEEEARRLLQKEEGEQPPLSDVVTGAAQAANRAVYESARQDAHLTGMGTTLVCLLTDGKQAVVGNIGDSRAYLIDGDGLHQVTSDHSLVAEMVRRGELSPGEARHHPNKNVITRALGVEQSVSCDVFPLTPGKGQFVLLCSDGLTNEVSEPEIYYEVFQSQEPEKACDTLIDIAKDRGGRDNITVLLASF